ncbi:UNVERIFIED_CONTAM: hypothetical protein Slati_0871400 [Sesamum latifolium]|uniref:DUF4283 domain-containing protein n=1 Tax=Sesamum latifolium TaxID=2727402 RepID=A0AAW2XMF4_9LAMI
MATFGPPLKPVIAHELTPYRPPLRPARRIPRLPTPDQERDILSRMIVPLPPPNQSVGSAQEAADDSFPTVVPPLSEYYAPPTMISSQTLAMQNRVLPQEIVPPIPHAAVDTPPLHKLGSSLPEATATAPGPSLSLLPTASLPLFIGNVPLAHPLVTDDKIAAAFHQSSRKMLSFVPPTLQNGEVVVRLSLDTIRDGSRRWRTTAVGYFLGKRPYFHHLNDYVRSVWPMVREVTATSNGFFFFQFKTTAAMEEVIEGGPWLF